MKRTIGKIVPTLGCGSGIPPHPIHDTETKQKACYEDA